MIRVAKATKNFLRRTFVPRDPRSVRQRAGEPTEATGAKTDAASRQEIRLERVTPGYWRVTLDNPPFNLFGPETIPQLNNVITQIETDPKVKVVVFQSAVPGFFLTHYDFVPPLSATTDIPPA